MTVITTITVTVVTTSNTATTATRHDGKLDFGEMKMLREATSLALQFSKMRMEKRKFLPTYIFQLTILQVTKFQMNFQ
jgi:hypothetical protein